MSNHKHTASMTRTSCFSHCIGGSQHSEASHGNIVELATCRCGAERSTEINGVHVHRGAWSAPAPKAQPIKRTELTARQALDPARTRAIGSAGYLYENEAFSGDAWHTLRLAAARGTSCSEEGGSPVVVTWSEGGQRKSAVVK